MTVIPGSLRLLREGGGVGGAAFPPSPGLWPLQQTLFVKPSERWQKVAATQECGDAKDSMLAPHVGIAQAQLRGVGRNRNASATGLLAGLLPQSHDFTRVLFKIS